MYNMQTQLKMASAASVYNHAAPFHRHATVTLELVERSTNDESATPVGIRPIDSTTAIIRMPRYWPRALLGPRDSCCRLCADSMRELIRLSSEKRSRHRSCLKWLGTRVWSYDGMCMPAWRPQPTNSRHGLPYQSADRRPTAVHRALASNEPKWPKTGVQPAEDPHYFALAIPESHRAGPCGLGGAPYGRRQSRRTDGARGRYPRGGKGVM